MHLEIAEAALLEAEEAQQHYRAIRPALGDDFAQVVQGALARIQEEPFMYQALRGPTRRCPLHRFPYTLIYLVRKDVVRVLAVTHQRRRPGYWQGR